VPEIVYTHGGHDLSLAYTAISAFAVRRASPHNLGSIAASTFGSATIAIAANLGSTATSTLITMAIDTLAGVSRGLNGGTGVHSQ